MNELAFTNRELHEMRLHEMRELTFDNWKEELRNNSFFLKNVNQIEPIMKAIVDERSRQALDAIVNLLGAMDAMEFVQGFHEEKPINHDKE